MYLTFGFLCFLKLSESHKRPIASHCGNGKMLLKSEKHGIFNRNYFSEMTNIQNLHFY